MPIPRLATLIITFVLAATPAAAAGPPRGSEELRPQDGRVYLPAGNGEFAALAHAPATFRFGGVLHGAVYEIEVPRERWNGVLVMWAHGYAGSDPHLGVDEPPIRRHLIEHGYAWAASSFSHNGYDVRSGIEDTNDLELSFVQLAREHHVTLPAPRRAFIAGGSMGGHIAAAAIERETLGDALHKVHYAGALPLCGTLADTAIADYFAAYHLAAFAVADFPAPAYPITDWRSRQQAVRSRLWREFPAAVTAQGERFRAIVMNLTGGRRPFFAEGFADPGMQELLWATGDRDGTLNGILNGNVADTRALVYRFATSGGPLSAEEQSFNARIGRAVPVQDANRRRRDGLRWVPQLQGEFDVPVITLHALGDLYVPMRFEQIYRERASAHGREKFLVQRLVRAAAHCGVTPLEAAAAFDDLVAWADGAPKPAGDDVLSAAALAAPDAGCRFTRNDPAAPGSAARLAAQSHYPACPGPR